MSWQKRLKKVKIKRIKSIVFPPAGIIPYLAMKFWSPATHPVKGTSKNWLSKIVVADENRLNY